MNIAPLHQPDDINPPFLLGGELPVDRLGFGTMRLPSKGGMMGGEPRDAESGRAVLRRAVELGVDHIDTALFYRSTDGAVVANTLVREALFPYPESLVIATKIGPIFTADGHRHGAPEELRGLLEENLTSLGLDRIDLVYLRIGEMEPPHGESLAERFEALAALREEGLIGHLGLSNVDADHLDEARAIAPVAAVQNNFSVANRSERAVLSACETAGIAFAPFFPLGGGTRQLDDPVVITVAERHGATARQVALAWLLAQSPNVLAIPGTGDIAHLEENVAASSIELSAEDLDDLSAEPDRA